MWWQLGFTNLLGWRNRSDQHLSWPACGFFAHWRIDILFLARWERINGTHALLVPSIPGIYSFLIKAYTTSITMCSIHCAGIMLHSFANLLCSNLFWHNFRKPISHRIVVSCWEVECMPNSVNDSNDVTPTCSLYTPLLVSQSRPFPFHSTNRFQYWHAKGLET